MNNLLLVGALTRAMRVRGLSWVLLVGLAVGCAGITRYVATTGEGFIGGGSQGPTTEEAMNRALTASASGDLKCPADQITLSRPRPAEPQFVGDGCGQRALYSMTCLTGSSACEFTMLSRATLDPTPSATPPTPAPSAR